MEEIKEPSYYIKQEMVKEKLSPLDLANRMGVARQSVNRLLNTNHTITHKTALRLAEAFKSTTVEYWLKKQMDYDLVSIRRN